MKTWVVAFFCALALGRADAQPGPNVLTAKSASGQFQAYAPKRPGLPIAIYEPTGVPGRFNLTPTERTNSDSKLPLDPFLLVMCCERIRDSLLPVLDRGDGWKGAITLLIAPNAPVDQGPMLEGIYGPKGWNYRLTLPSPIETNLLLRAVVQAILTETANRSAGEHSAEVPGWLVTGLSAHLQADSEPTTLLRVQSRLNTNRIKMPAMEAVRGLLRQETPISFQELCWPGPELAAGRSNELYAACAQVFVEELLQFPDGSRRLGAMIDRLPQHLNWQTSFLEAFDGHFGQLVDVEKWWGLVCVNFTGVDFASRFSPVDSWHKLQEALDVPVQVHFSPDRLPVEAVVTLQEAIRTWGPAESEAALERAFEKLLTLRRQVTPKLRPLLDAYLEVVEGCEDGTRPVVNTGWGKRVTPPMAVLRNAACKKLNALDAQRESMRKQYVPQPAQTQLSPRDRPPGSPGADKPATPHP